MENQIALKKIGVVFFPPSIVLLYSEKGVYKKRTMPLRDLTENCDCNQLANRLKARHKQQLGSVNTIRLEMLIRLAQEHLKGSSKSEALDLIRKDFEINPVEDLNKLSDKELKRRKEIMDLSYEKNTIGKDHPDFVYDKEVEFGGQKGSNEWDSGSEKSGISEHIAAGHGVSKGKDAEMPTNILRRSSPADSDRSEDSTPVNSPLLKLKTLVASKRSVFGLDSPREEVEPEQRVDRPLVEPSRQPRSISGGEDNNGEEEDDEFW